jgi:hypothetical protein
MKIDTYKHKERYLKWRESAENGIPNISKKNSDIILKYLDDMSNGVNISAFSAKGSRSYIRLNTLRDKMRFFAMKFKERFNLDDITKIPEEDLVIFFAEMRKGIITRIDGGTFKSTGYYTKNFKAFWHWWMKINRKKGIKVPDITVDLDTKEEKPRWVYLNEKQVKILCENANFKHKVLMMFLFDTGIRSPTELMNVKVSDLYNNCKELRIREEVVKKGSFGRRIKLMICSELIKEYIKSNNLELNDYLFQITPHLVNKYLKRLAKRILGDKLSLGGQKYSELTMYDFRHISTCYWLPRYKSESALKFRFGWKKSDKIHYYSELLGMRDTITEEDLLIDVTKTEIEKRLTKTENEKKMLQERVQILEGQMKEIIKLSNYARQIA